jgi:hypothetical protein
MSREEQPGEPEWLKQPQGELVSQFETPQILTRPGSETLFPVSAQPRILPQKGEFKELKLKEVKGEPSGEDIWTLAPELKTFKFRSRGIPQPTPVTLHSKYLTTLAADVETLLKNIQSQRDQREEEALDKVKSNVKTLLEMVHTQHKKHYVKPQDACKNAQKMWSDYYLRQEHEYQNLQKIQSLRQSVVPLLDAMIQDVDRRYQSAQLEKAKWPNIIDRFCK